MLRGHGDQQTKNKILLSFKQDLQFNTHESDIIRSYEYLIGNIRQQTPKILKRKSEEQRRKSGKEQENNDLSEYFNGINI